MLRVRHLWMELETEKLAPTCGGFYGRKWAFVCPARGLEPATEQQRQTQVTSAQFRPWQLIAPVGQQYNTVSV